MFESLLQTLKNSIGEQGRETLSFFYWHVVAPLLDQSSLHWIFLVSNIALAWLYFIATRARNATNAGGERPNGFLGFLLPPEQWRHPSAAVDRKFYVINQLIMANLRVSTFVVGLVGLLLVQEHVQEVLGLAFAPAAATTEPGALALVGFTLAMGIAFDYARYLSHRLHHSVPLLWEFHKVHHSAKVLTIFTAYRNHPLEGMIELALRLIATALVSGVFGFFYPKGLAEFTVLNYGALTFLFYLTAHLRHSSIPMDFGRLRGTFISPRMHQLHHSAHSAHFDKNFGFILSCWDRWGGTLYLPAPEEQFDLGLPPEAGRFETTRDLFLQPFVACFKRIREALVGPRQVTDR